MKHPLYKKLLTNLSKSDIIYDSQMTVCEVLCENTSKTKATVCRPWLFYFCRSRWKSNDIIPQGNQFVKNDFSNTKNLSLIAWGSIGQQIIQFTCKHIYISTNKYADLLI